jgi:hypothetical protein
LHNSTILGWATLGETAKTKENLLTKQQMGYAAVRWWFGGGSVGGGGNNDGLMTDNNNTRTTRQPT